YNESVDHVLDATEPRQELVKQFEADMIPRHRALGDALDALDAFREAQVAVVRRQADRAFVRGLTVSACATATAIAASIGLAYGFARRLSHAYEDTHEAMRVAREAVAARDDVLGVLAHDLRSPLAAICLKAALIGKGTDPAAAVRHANAIARVGDRMERLIKMLLDAASIDAGRFAVAPEPRKAEELLEDVRETFGELAAARSVRLDVPAADPALGVMADRERVGEALGNLVAN